MSPFKTPSTKVKLTITIDESGLESVVTLRGLIDEDADFKALNVAKSSNLVFDLGGIELTNSVGIRGWVNWMKANRAKNFIFRNCSRAITDQINVLEGFLPPFATVESFYVPYVCEKCAKGHEVLFKKGVEFERATADKPSWLKPPLVTCESCGGEMKLGVVEAKYFRFLKYR